MPEVDDVQLHQRYAGCYVARRDGEVVASAESYDALTEQLQKMRPKWDELLIEYVEPADTISVY